MDYTRKRIFLEQHLEKIRRKANLEERIKKTKSIALKITPSLSETVSGNSGENKMQKAIEKLDELQKENALLAQQIHKENYIICVAASGLKKNLYEIFTDRYINALDIKHIAIKRNYCERHIKRLISKSIENLSL